MVQILTTTLRFLKSGVQCMQKGTPKQASHLCMHFTTLNQPASYNAQSEPTPTCWKIAWSPKSSRLNITTTTTNLLQLISSYFWLPQFVALKFCRVTKKLCSEVDTHNLVPMKTLIYGFSSDKDTISPSAPAVSERLPRETAGVKLEALMKYNFDVKITRNSLHFG